MNTDCEIHTTTERGRTWPHVRRNGGWRHIAPSGMVRRLGAERLLSHLLPSLASDQPSLSVKVEWGGRRSSRLPASVVE